MKERRDVKHRLLMKNEYQRSDGRYMFKYRDVKGVDRYVYSWTLTQSDRPPQGKPLGKCLRVLEKEIQRDILEDVDSFKAKKLTLDTCFNSYLSRKRGLKKSTLENYKYYYKYAIKEELGHRRISDIKYSDIQRFYDCLLNERGFQPNTIEIINAILHPIFRSAIRDGYIRVNPTDGVLTELKQSIGWTKQKKKR